EVERLYYIGPMFRYERPQKGRYRQFSQIGVEVFGSAHPALDAEVIDMAVSLFAGLGIADARLQVNSVGHPECRARYREALRQSLEPRRAELCADCRRRLDTNPLRILDCKVPECGVIRREAPGIQEFLCEECRDHMAGVLQALETLGTACTVNPALVRGLDYYTRTTFEITSGRLGAQNALCGGGRYDGLVASMGGPPIAGFGFAIGADRLVLAVLEGEEGGQACAAPIELYIVHLGEPALQAALAAAKALRGLGLAVRLDPDARDLRKQMARASSSGARYAIILGEREMERSIYALKRLADGTQTEVAAGDFEAIAKEVAHGGDGAARA
ncbi:MAG TPA: histidine--tRNA ligase, partial [Candidatus Polarisedimenticolia bacterium]|nr:histidine--tRNA ligase [Candidatus Polarisedimenticolia bacterium]